MPPPHLVYRGCDPANQLLLKRSHEHTGLTVAIKLSSDIPNPQWPIAYHTSRLAVRASLVVRSASQVSRDAFRISPRLTNVAARCVGDVTPVTSPCLISLGLVPRRLPTALPLPIESVPPHRDGRDPVIAARPSPITNQPRRLRAPKSISHHTRQLSYRCHFLSSLPSPPTPSTANGPPNPPPATISPFQTPPIQEDARRANERGTGQPHPPSPFSSINNSRRHGCNC